jgi:gamma-aminobutyric acid type B receptor
VGSVGFASWTIVNRKKRVVAASQPFFLCLLCFGCFVLGSSLIVVPIDHGSSNMTLCDGHGDLDPCGKACTATVWLVSLGLSISFSALFAKTWRINRIMKNSMKLKRITVTVWDMLKPVSVVLACTYERERKYLLCINFLMETRD